MLQFPKYLDFHQTKGCLINNTLRNGIYDDNEEDENELLHVYDVWFCVKMWYMKDHYNMWWLFLLLYYKRNPLYIWNYIIRYIKVEMTHLNEWICNSNEMALEIHNEIKIHNDKNIVQTKEWRYTREKGIHTHVMRNNEILKFLQMCSPFSIRI